MHASSGFDLERFLSRLVDDGKLTLEEVKRTQTASRETNISISRALLELGLIKEEVLYTLLAKELGLPLISISEIDASLPARLRLNPAFLKRVRILPHITSDGALTLVTSELECDNVIKSIAFHIERPVSHALATPSQVSNALASLEPNDTGDVERASDADIEQLQQLANQGPTIELVNRIAHNALRLGASDIHFEATDQGGRVRLRIDGMLRPHESLSQRDFSATLSRIKVLSRLNISEKRRPQDGRIRLVLRGRAIDFRVSTLPTQFGESAVLRLLDQTSGKLSWVELGFSKQISDAIVKIGHQPNGLFLVSGPTGSGKTTTLYTLLNELNDTNRKLVTVEDPIEYSLPGVNQVPVAPEIDVTFAKALRAILRQDPDVIMVGEIRDEETAEISTRAALVGRLVLSTVHANDSFGVIERLINLGVPPYLIGATLRGVLSQRLVPKLCKKCGGNGCKDCAEIGVSGRVAITELLAVNEPIAQAIAEREPLSRLHELAAEAGFISMQQNARDLADVGLIRWDSAEL
ncbi:GspE/PulE family protein [Fontisubflavum oceani]|uniref:GspE/PulE family protein n=1 Tax=Fontisubflavum oceani TaxID=2978973 RepID=UPI0025B61F03|nr:GspE/PulE family protein [Fontisubflavum oceani]WJY23288.1 GspE/PulE family protein [Fontisubflavum oceani]